MPEGSLLQDFYLLQSKLDKQSASSRLSCQGQQDVDVFGALLPAQALHALPDKPPKPISLRAKPSAVIKFKPKKPNLSARAANWDDFAGRAFETSRHAGDLGPEYVDKLFPGRKVAMPLFTHYLLVAMCGGTSPLFTFNEKTRRFEMLPDLTVTGITPFTMDHYARKFLACGSLVRELLTTAQDIGSISPVHSALSYVIQRSVIRIQEIGKDCSSALVQLSRYCLWASTVLEILGAIADKSDTNTAVGIIDKVYQRLKLFWDSDSCLYSYFEHVFYVISQPWLDAWSVHIRYGGWPWSGADTASPAFLSEEVVHLAASCARGHTLMRGSSSNVAVSLALEWPSLKNDAPVAPVVNFESNTSATDYFKMLQERLDSASALSEDPFYSTLQSGWQRRETMRRENADLLGDHLNRVFCQKLSLHLESVNHMFKTAFESENSLSVKDCIHTIQCSFLLKNGAFIGAMKAGLFEDRDGSLKLNVAKKTKLSWPPPGYLVNNTISARIEEAIDLLRLHSEINQTQCLNFGIRRDSRLKKMSWSDLNAIHVLQLVFKIPEPLNRVLGKKVLRVCDVIFKRCLKVLWLSSCISSQLPTKRNMEALLFVTEIRNRYTMCLMELNFNIDGLRESETDVSDISAKMLRELEVCVVKMGADHDLELQEIYAEIWAQS